MIYEVRTYTLRPGTLAEFEERYAKRLPLREKHSKLGAFWHTEFGPLNQVIHVYPYDDPQHRTRVRTAMAQDAERTRGEARSWSRGTDSGNRLKCFFCPRCGSRIWHESDPLLDTVTVKAGSLDQSVDASGATHIWTSRAPTGIVIPAAAMKFPEEPL